jgi:hypothetical protein
VYLAYIDESGDSGPTASGGSRTYSLGCVLVDAARWPEVFDDLIAFRRFIRDAFRIPVRAEIKASELIAGKGVFRLLGTSDVERRAIFRLHMTIQPKLGLRAFAVVTPKDELFRNRPDADPRDTAWEALLNRLERIMFYDKHPILINHDEGEDAIIRKLARKARRAGTAGSRFGTGMLKVPARLLIDDPIPRRSDHSYFIQLADLNAYAAYRRVFPPPKNRYTIVPQSTWDRLGSARHWQANQYSGGPEGIVVRSR